MSAFEHLGFKSIDKQIQTKTYSNVKYIGELNSNNQEHGKGVYIFNGKDNKGKNIMFAQLENGKHVEGNYIAIFEDG